MPELNNTLAGESSPYLRQHAHQPVAWQTWNEQTLAMARALDRPILLSIGYSACHWCHVMAHECFDDPAVAAVMNRHFVNVKVDREERPDLDQIYQLAHQLLTGRPGGWPLTMFLTPAGVPFYGGTYFPKSPRHGLPAFPDLCARIALLWQQRRQAIETQNRELLTALQQIASPNASETNMPSAAAPAARLTEALLGAADWERGGFGGAPKFPHPADLAFLLERDGAGRRFALLTLDRMAAGGIHDQLGGGFFRYSVDERWEIPHFEKMLYDNAQLLDLYSLAAAISGNPRYQRVAAGIVAWLEGEMRSPNGAFYSALDADSEGEEGRYYLWQKDEIRQLLDEKEWEAASRCWGLAGPPNFAGRHHLVLREAPTAHEAVALAAARQKLLAARAKRRPPACDDKLLTSWNALTAAALLRAARRLDRPAWGERAEQILAFLVDRRVKAGAVLTTDSLPGYLDDHAFLLDALLERLQWRFRPEDLTLATALAASLLARFEDAEKGGFFFTAHDHERLIVRSKDARDGALPAGYGIAVRALLRLARLTGESRHLDAAERAVKVFQPLMDRQPYGMATLIAAQEEALAPPPLVVLRGPAEEMTPWRQALARRRVMCLALPNSLADPLPPLLAHAPTLVVNAWVCRGVECLAPVQTIEQLMAILPEAVAPARETNQDG